jgi:hypothetical protein
MANVIKIIMFVVTNWKEIYTITQKILHVLEGGADEKTVDASFEKKGVLCSLTGICKVK